MSADGRVAPARPRPVGARFPRPSSTTRTTPRPRRSFPPCVRRPCSQGARWGAQRTLIREHPHEVATVLLGDRATIDLERLPELPPEGGLADSETQAPIVLVVDSDRPGRLERAVRPEGNDGTPTDVPHRDSKLGKNQLRVGHQLLGAPRRTAELMPSGTTPGGSGPIGT